jgi:hypothetical protein
MAEGSGGGGNSGLAFIVGGLLVVVAVIGFMMFNGGSFSPAPAKKSVDINISAPKVPTPGD